MNLLILCKEEIAEKKRLMYMNDKKRRKKEVRKVRIEGKMNETVRRWSKMKNGL